MQTAPSHAAGALRDALRAWSARQIFESAVGLDVEVRGRASPTLAERRDGFVGIQHAAPGDAPGEWVLTTQHAAHWFDAQWREIEVTDLGRRYSQVHPVRLVAGGALSLVAEEGNVTRVVEFDRRGREVGRIDLRASTRPAFGDLDGDRQLEVVAGAGRTVTMRGRTGAPRTLTFDTPVTDIDVVPGTAGGGDRLLLYRPSRASRGTRVEVVGADGGVDLAWDEADASRYSVVRWDAGHLFVSHADGVLRLRDAAGRPLPSRASGYHVRTRHARAVKLDSGHEVFLLYNWHYATSALVVFDASGRRVHREHPGGFSSTLWTTPGEPGAFFVAVGPDIVRYRLRP
jgi:hypothetical protein